jgi:HPt (histidine-containing phosphotransfer) domain-containing protein
MTKIINLDLLSRTVNGNKKVIVEIMNVFLEQLPDDIVAINEAVEKTDFVAVKRQCHKMKSSVAIMGIDALVALLEEMEELGNKAENIERIKELNTQVDSLARKAIQEVKEETSNFS